MLVILIAILTESASADPRSQSYEAGPTILYEPLTPPVWVTPLVLSGPCGDVVYDPANNYQPEQSNHGIGPGGGPINPAHEDFLMHVIRAMWPSAPQVVSEIEGYEIADMTELSPFIDVLRKPDASHAWFWGDQNGLELYQRGERLIVWRKENADILVFDKVGTGFVDVTLGNACGKWANYSREEALLALLSSWGMPDPGFGRSWGAPHYPDDNPAPPRWRPTPSPAGGTLDSAREARLQQTLLSHWPFIGYRAVLGEWKITHVSDTRVRMMNTDTGDIIHLEPCGNAFLEVIISNANDQAVSYSRTEALEIFVKVLGLTVPSRRRNLDPLGPSSE